jgi:hypothetical protein
MPSKEIKQIQYYTRKVAEVGRMKDYERKRARFVRLAQYKWGLERRLDEVRWGIANL